LRAQDRILLLGSLASLLESVPARSVRLVVFNLDQQKELFRQDDLAPESFGQVAQAINGLQLQLVDYHVLEKRNGYVELLADLVNQELRSAEPPDAVIILGPPTRYYDKLQENALEQHVPANPQFFFLEYKPYWRHVAELPDLIASAVKKLKGKILMVHTPADFAKAIQQIDTQVAGDK
jgi:hypothetical protein